MQNEDLINYSYFWYSCIEKKNINSEMLLCRMLISGKNKSGVIPVYLNVYDLTPINGYAYWLGLGVYHSGVQVHGVEYAFGAHEQSNTGIFEVEPKRCPGFTFRKSILIGKTDMDAKEVQLLLQKLATEYSGNTYNLITRNCNHFCNDLCMRLTKKSIPNWVNRLARLGFLCNCVLPTSLNETRVRHIKPEDGMYKKKKLRTTHSDSSIPSSSQQQQQQQQQPNNSSSVSSKSARHRNSSSC